MAFAATLRFHDLGAKSLWLDEIIGSEATRLQSLGALVVWVKADIDQMPAFPAMTWMLRGFGDSELALRLPAAVAGVLTIAAVIWFAKQAFGARVAFVSSLVMAVNPFAEWYSQEARSYALLMLLTTLQMAFAYRVGRDRKLFDWGALTLVSILNLYTHYMALAATAAAYAYLALSLMAGRRDRKALVQVATRGLASLALILLAYSPWLHALSAFLRSGSKGFARYGPDGQVTLSQALALLDRLGFSALLVVFMALGLIAAVARAIRTPPKADGNRLLIAWLCLPLLALAARLRGSTLYLDPRYLSFLVPAMALLCAVGAVEVGHLVEVGAGRLRAFRTTGLAAPAAVIIGGLLAVQTVPALADALTRPKDDYRGMAAYVTALSPPNSIVIGLGQHSAFIATGLGHYLRETGSAVMVADAAAPGGSRLSQLTGDQGEAWGAVFEPSRVEIANAKGLGFDVDLRFTHMLLVRPDQSLSRAAQIVALLAWDSS